MHLGLLEVDNEERIQFANNSFARCVAIQRRNFWASYLTRYLSLLEILA